MTDTILTIPSLPATPRVRPAWRAGVAFALVAAFVALVPESALVPPGPAGGPRPSVSAILSVMPALPAPVEVPSSGRLERLFDRLGYRLEAVGERGLAVPSIELAALPGDLDAMPSIERRKALFIRAVLPVVLRANAAVLDERARLEAIAGRLAAGALPRARDRAEFERIAGRYGAPETAMDAEGVRLLLTRVDAVPVSLAVAQAISESGWGTSRFARVGNALFGQWTWDPAAGLLPADRPTGRGHRVRAFRSLTDSAHAYLFNLNSHPAYEGFRKARAAARAGTGDQPQVRVLAGHLTRYSERRHAYVEDILALIRQNRLDRLDGAVLGEPTRYADADPLAAGLVDG